MTMTTALVQRLWSIRAEDLGPEDRTAAAQLLLDHTGVVARGSQIDTARVVREYLDPSPTSPGDGSLPVIGADLELPAMAAAMANAVAGHCLEFDDVHNASSSHPGVVIFPAAMAAARMSGAGDEAFLRGVVIGYETMCRLGRAANPAAHYGRHFHPTATTGYLGAAAACASILDLHVDAAVSALGIAATAAAGSMQFVVDGAWTKRFHPALAARGGLEAALMAARGFVGTEDGIGGTHGFLATYTDDPRPEALLAGWGEMPLEIRNTSIKVHTCCRYKQGPIDALIQIRSEEGIAAEDVAGVWIGLPRAAMDIVWEPIERKRRPRSIVDAQFSMPYGAAVALFRGRASLEEYDGALFQHPEVERLMDTVECEVDPEVERHYPEQWRARVLVSLRDGTKHEREVIDPKGDPANPLTPEELRAKFDDLAAEIFPGERRDAIAAAAAAIGELGSLETYLSLVGSRPPP